MSPTPTKPRPFGIKAGAAPGRQPWPHYRLAPGTMPLARCRGAFGRTCLMATTALLCGPCWDELERVVRRHHRTVAGRLRPSVALPRQRGDTVWAPGAIEAPIRGEVE